jgi:hypothetical protein
MASRFGPAYVKRTIRYNSVRKGLMGGSRFWLAVFIGGYVARWSGKVTKRGEKPIRFSESLKPGESFVIRHVGSTE